MVRAAASSTRYPVELRPTSGSTRGTSFAPFGAASTSASPKEHPPLATGAGTTPPTSATTWNSSDVQCTDPARVGTMMVYPASFTACSAGDTGLRLAGDEEDAGAAAGTEVDAGEASGGSAARVEDCVDNPTAAAVPAT